MATTIREIFAIRLACAIAQNKELADADWIADRATNIADALVKRLDRDAQKQHDQEREAA